MHEDIYGGDEICAIHGGGIADIDKLVEHLSSVLDARCAGKDGVIGKFQS